MKPTEFEHANRHYKSNAGVLPINIVKRKGKTTLQLSIWKGSWYERLSFLINGKINVMVYGDTIVPMAIGAGVEKQMEFRE